MSILKKKARLLRKKLPFRFPFPAVFPCQKSFVFFLLSTVLALPKLLFVPSIFVAKIKNVYAI